MFYLSLSLSIYVYIYIYTYIHTQIHGTCRDICECELQAGALTRKLKRPASAINLPSRRVVWETTPKQVDNQWIIIYIIKACMYWWIFDILSYFCLHVCVCALCVRCACICLGVFASGAVSTVTFSYTSARFLLLLSIVIFPLPVLLLSLVIFPLLWLLIAIAHWHASLQECGPRQRSRWSPHRGESDITLRLSDSRLCVAQTSNENLISNMLYFAIETRVRRCTKKLQMCKDKRAKLSAESGVGTLSRRVLASTSFAFAYAGCRQVAQLSILGQLFNKPA